MRLMADIARAMADQNRIRILASLFDRELCVCQILALFDLAPSTVSKHLFILKQARLVDTRKKGKWIYYRLADKDAAPEIKSALGWLKKGLAEDKMVAEDSRKLEKILRMEPVVLCCRRRETA